MSWRSRVRTSLVYLVSVVAGFSLAYLLVAFVVFPAGVVPRDVKVPNVLGLTYDEAEQRLAQAGFRAEQGEQRYNASSPKMTVLEQTPPPGSSDRVGGVIILAVSGGQRTTAVPTVTGMPRDEAIALLEKEGFEIGEVSQAPSTAPQGSVTATRPAVGSQVSVPSTVHLVLASPEATVNMPDLMGQDVDAARATLQQLRVRNVQVIRDPSGVGPVGSVVGQSPVPNAALPPGAPVQLRVAVEPPPAPYSPPLPPQP